MDKKGQIFEQISGLAIGILGLMITLVVVFVFMSQTASNTTVAADGNASAAVDSLQTAAAGIPDWVPLVVLAVIATILLGIVAYFKSS